MQGFVARVWIGFGFGLGLALCLALAPALARAGSEGGVAVIADPAGGPGDETAVQLVGSKPPSVSASVDERGTDSGYNSDYLFGLSRGLAGSSLAPAIKPAIFIVTVPLDIALFPFALIGGLFG